MNNYLNRHFFIISILCTIILFLSSNNIIQKINVNLGIDFTSTKTFSLSEGTKRVINEIEEPIKIMGMIAWQFRVIWEVKNYQQRNIPSNQIAKAMGANPFVVEKALQHTKNFSNQQLRRAYLQLTQADRSLKSTSQDPVFVMQTLILGLTATRH